MKSGYETELKLRIEELDTAKASLEELYMSTETEESIQADPARTTMYNEKINSVTNIVNVLNGTLKTVKLAVDTCHVHII